MKNTQLVEDCKLLKTNDVIKRQILSFDELFNMKYPAEVSQGDLSYMGFFHKFEVCAITKKDFVMNVWNGVHPVDKNMSEHICPKGTRVRIWMVSRMGDIGITDNLINPIGYNCRGVIAEELEDWEFKCL